MDFYIAHCHPSHIQFYMVFKYLNVLSKKYRVIHFEHLRVKNVKVGSV